MLHLKSYVGSIVLAGLLLQGCGSSSDETAATAPQTSAEVIKTEKAMVALTATLNSLDGTEDDATIDAAFDKLKLELSASESSATTATAMQTAGVLSGLTDKVKEKLVDAMDTSVGNKVTSAAFDVVLDSEGVTVVMLDAARKSHTMTRIMIDALEADWSLTAKMCPMLQTNQEFGEKFAALAEEEPQMARFFFSRVDAPMYNCLADAMLLSNNDANHDASVKYSTNTYMGILMNKYATEYFVPHNSGSNKITKDENVDGVNEAVKYSETDAEGNLATDDNFVNLLFDTKEVVTYDGNNTFTGHGDGNELINEKFFYSLFKTPTSTDSFVAAMDKLPDATVTGLMDNIFLGQSSDTNDTMQGYLNIISIGSAMYDGIYGEKDSETGSRTNAYGFGSYTGAFIGFAGLIPNDRYLTYGKAFMNAGYQYASMHGIDVWKGASEAAQTAWNEYSASNDENVTAAAAPQRSAGLGVISSNWYEDVFDLMLSAWSTVDLADLGSALIDSDKSIMAEINDQGNVAYGTFIDGKDEDNKTSYPTVIHNDLTINNDTVYGIHGLIELAMQEDIYYVTCGNRSTDYINGSDVMCENNDTYTMSNAKEAFTLPAFADLTMEFAYNSAYDGAMAYASNIDETWIADLSTNDLVREYFYPDANNTYIPSSLLAIDWLQLPANYASTNVEDTDFAFDFNSGYFDIYVVSTNDNLINEVNLPQVSAPVKTITMEKVTALSESIIAVDAEGKDLEKGLNVYKIRVVSPADTEAVLAYLAGYTDTALNAIGIDTTNAADVDTTASAQ